MHAAATIPPSTGIHGGGQQGGPPGGGGGGGGCAIPKFSPIVKTNRPVNAMILDILGIYFCELKFNPAASG
jgi:hypothetical protein